MVKNLPASARDIRNVGSISGLERSPGVGNDNPFQYSYLENSMDSLPGYSPWFCRIGHYWGMSTVSTGLDGNKVYVRLSVTINIFLSFISLTEICMFNIYKSLFKTVPYRTWASVLNWLNFMVFKL